MVAAAWWAVGIAGFILVARFSLGLVGRAGHVLGRRRQAELRAEALLLGWLSPGQRAQYRAHGRFDVVTAAGHRYRVWPRKVVRLDGYRSAYCIEAMSWVPAADQMLAKKLLLETNERRFLATAHRYR
jgi:hypothetical protein